MSTLPKSYAHAPKIPEGNAVALASLVPGSGPLLLEIGSGRGAFAMEYAELHPGRRVLAFEIRRKWAAIVGEKFAARKLDNARCFAEDARHALPRLAPDGAVEAVVIHFPDPWWKKRHAKRLVVGDSLLLELARLLTPGGLVFVQTDVDTRADEYLEQFASVTQFVNAAPAGERFVSESPFAPARSNREKRAIEDGLPVFRMLFRRA